MNGACCSVMPDSDAKRDTVRLPNGEHVGCNALLSAFRVTEVTCLGALTGTYPVPHGNCFGVETEGGRYFSIVNFACENWEEMLRRGLELPVAVLPLSDRVAVIHDKRIPHNWYYDDFCTVCCPEDLLPLHQRLARHREILQGVRKVSEYIVSYNPQKAYNAHLSGGTPSAPSDCSQGD